MFSSVSGSNFIPSGLKKLSKLDHLKEEEQKNREKLENTCNQLVESVKQWDKCTLIHSMLSWNNTVSK